VQFVRPERLEVITGAAPPEIEWLGEADIAERLRALREDHSAWRIPRDTGQFSLAGPTMTSVVITSPMLRRRCLRPFSYQEVLQWS
jgi:hypothetical protein